MKLSDISIERPVLTWMMTAALATFGVLGFLRLGIDRFPDMEFPFVGAVVTLNGASPSTMEDEVADVLEEAFATIEGVRHIYSQSTHGAATVMVEFDLGHDVDVAAQDIRDKLNGAMNELPDEIDPPGIGKWDVSSHPIIFAPIGSELSETETTEYVKEHIKPFIDSIPGAAGVTLYGAVERNIRIWIDPAALRARNLAITDVLDALRREHVDRPGGFVEGRSIEWVLKTDAEFRSVDELGSMIISWDGDAPIRLRDVARLEDGAEDVRGAAHMNGEPGIAIGVSKQSDGNTVAIVDEFRRRMEELRERTPPTIHITEAEGYIDNSESIREAFQETMFALVFGGFLAVLVVFVFMRRTRPTFIVALSIPLSLITTFGMIWIFDFTLNTMTLLGLTLAIGVVIDDAIIVLENIERHREAGRSAKEAAREGTREITFAAAAATFSVAAVFIPVAFAEGQMGSFLKEFGVTVAVAVIVSLFVALTLTPMLAARMPAPKERGPDSIHQRLERWFDALEEGYRKVLTWSLGNRLKTFGIALAAIVLAYVAGKQLPGEFMPAGDTSFAVFEFRTPPGTSLEATVEMLERNEAWLLAQPEVISSFAKIGGTSISISGPNVGMINARLVPIDQRERSTKEFTRDAREALSAIPGQEFVVLGSFGFAERDLEFEIRGHASLEELDHYSDIMLGRMREQGGVVDLEKEIKLGLPEARIVPDREKAAALGIDADTIARIVLAMIGGLDVGTFRDGEERHDIRLRMERDERDTLDSVGDLWVRTRSGDLVDLRNVVRIEKGATASTISHTDRLRSAEIMMNLEGIDLDEAVKRGIAIADEVLPPHLELHLRGDAEDSAEAGRQFGLMLVLAVLVIYMVLAAQFESFTQPLIVMLALPFSMTGALGGLLVMGMSLNLFSMIGIVLLIGLVTKNSILLVDYANQLREQGATAEEAIRRAAPVRMRPVLMTALSMIFGVLPAAFGIGPGAESRAPMAVATAAGMFSSMLLTLLVVPVFYLTLETTREFLRSPRENWSRWRLARSGATS
ncbi:MAG: efflux RND transporter permease subunit [Deltaproteobacteria bacterium]|nr:efflux RND transporter permease subunit [Deltaproteobacteria bacterium]MBW2359521.1 efflux RND transporter permease subunit [Deltaproteobacteria bacterium]